MIIILSLHAFLILLLVVFFPFHILLRRLAWAHLTNLISVRRRQNRADIRRVARLVAEAAHLVLQDGLLLGVGQLDLLLGGPVDGRARYLFYLHVPSFCQVRTHGLHARPILLLRLGLLVRTRSGGGASLFLGTGEGLVLGKRKVDARIRGVTTHLAAVGWQLRRRLLNR